MIGAYVKMMRRIRQVCVMGCVIQSSDRLSLCILPMETVSQKVDAIPRIFDIEKAFKYAPLRSEQT